MDARLHLAMRSTWMRGVLGWLAAGLMFLLGPMCAWGYPRGDSLPGVSHLGRTYDLAVGRTAAFAYDASGNLTNDGRRSFTYDARGRLESITVPNAWRSQFVHDGLNRLRVRTEFTWSGGAWVTNAVVRYVYAGGLVVEERNGSNNATTVAYTRGLDLSGSLGGAGGIGGLLALTRYDTASPSHAWYHADGSGNVTALVNANQYVVARYQYDPFGGLVAQSGPWSEANRLRFSSKEWHAASGTYGFGRRFYDPGLQRWLNPDPIGIAGGLNLYGFVGNNPVGNVDPWGLEALNEDPDIARWTSGDVLSTMDPHSKCGGMAKFAEAVGFFGDSVTDPDKMEEALEEMPFVLPTAIAAALHFAEGEWEEGFKDLAFAALGAKGRGSSAGAKSVASGTARNAAEETRFVPNGPPCFAAGTLVATDRGLRAIETLEPGDQVWAFNEGTGEPALRNVLEVYKRHTDEVLDLDIGEISVRTTREHPFWMEGLGWTAAGELRVGDFVKTLRGAAATVRRVEVRREPAIVYNLAVDNLHSYSVSSSELLVHNQCKVLPAAKGTTRAPDFIVSPGGTAFPVPKGASGPFPAASGKGFHFTGGSGGHGLSPRTTDVRIMDPVTTGKHQYPSGYGSYGNAAGQTVNPFTGRTITKSDPLWHIPTN